MSESPPIIEVRGVVKRYPGVVALGGVSISISSGEVVALIGENGAGKSTTMKILGGIVRPDEGQILVDGKPVEIDSVKRSVEFGIGFIHQELNSLDNLDVAGNVFLGREPAKWGLIDRAKMHTETKAVLNRLGLNVEPDTPLSKLSLAQRQMVEIAKALSLNARVLIMDEPTSSLTLTETERLLDVVRELRAQGVGIIYISHRLGEVHEIADRVVAFRDGKNAGGLTKSEITHEAMVRLMVGRELVRVERDPDKREKPVRLSVKDLRTARYPNKTVSFDVLAGEVFCLAGLVGAGRSEVVQTIFGTDAPQGGSVALDGNAVRLGSPKSGIEAGIGLVPEDRRHTGLLVEWSIRDNISIPSLEDFATAGIISRREETEAASEQSKAIGVKTPSIDVAAANLSGGNQQKVVLAKWLLRKPKVLILDEPTRGVDVGAKVEIYTLINQLAERGKAVLVISSEHQELMGLCDRIMVMGEGRIRGELRPAEYSEEAILSLSLRRDPGETHGDPHAGEHASAREGASLIHG